MGPICSRGARKSQSRHPIRDSFQTHQRSTLVPNPSYQVKVWLNLISLPLQARKSGISANRLIKTKSRSMFLTSESMPALSVNSVCVVGAPRVIQLQPSQHPLCPSYNHLFLKSATLSDFLCGQRNLRRDSSSGTRRFSE